MFFLAQKCYCVVRYQIKHMADFFQLKDECILSGFPKLYFVISEVKCKYSQNSNLYKPVLRIRDPCLVDPWIRVPGWVTNQDSDQGWTTRIIPPRAWKHYIGLKIKILKFFDADPGWKKFGSGIPDKHLGSSTLVQTSVAIAGQILCGIISWTNTWRSFVFDGTSWNVSFC